MGTRAALSYRGAIAAVVPYGRLAPALAGRPRQAPLLPALRRRHASGRQPGAVRQVAVVVVAAAGAAAGGRPAAVAAAAVAGASEQGLPQSQGLVGALVNSVQLQFRKLDGLWNRFLPMSLLFFLMAFVNTIVDSLKDSLVITAVGGGTEVIPYLTVYAVLPSSVLFLVAYAWGTQRFSREKLFNIIVGSFLAFYGGFALVYPHHGTLHLHGLAAQLSTFVPVGLSGMIGVIRNWTFAIFYCVSELWGDVVLSLLFWGLANETTSIEDAPLLYPLFGIGANIAQTIAGRMLRLSSDAAAGSAFNYTAQLQGTMCLCLGLGVSILLLHAWISRTFPKNPKGSKTLEKAAALQRLADASAAAAAAASNAESGGRSSANRHMALDLEAAVQGLNYCSLEGKQQQQPRQQHAPASSSSSAAGLPRRQDFADGTAAAAAGAGAAAASSSSHTANGHAAHAAPAGQAGHSGQGAAAEQQQQQHANQQQQQQRTGGKQQAKKKKEAMSMRDAWQFLCKSPQIRCLAVMALAQGITTNLLDLAWKHYLHKLATTPAAYSAFLGDTAMWTGVTTGTLMFASPLLFDRVGWRGVASATPNFMLYAGLPFFAACIAYTFMAGSQAVGPAGAVLFGLVIAGAVLQVFSRGAKFSLFKPAEEMVYIGLDDESRTKGKAAIDVVGAQSGKSIGSMLQQALLIISGGTLGGILPLLAIFYVMMLKSWLGALEDLSAMDPSHVHRVSVAGSLDEEDLPAAAAAGAVAMAAAAAVAAAELPPQEGDGDGGRGGGGMRVPAPASGAV